MIDGKPLNYHLQDDCRQKEAEYKKFCSVTKDKCLICGRTSKQTQLHHHHEDYGRPMRVITLCWRCHKKYHKKWHHFVDLSDQINPIGDVNNYPLPACLFLA
jgi:hypothetical protein